LPRLLNLPSRVVLLVNRSQIFAIDMRVDLRRREIRVAEHLLHRSEVRSTLEEVRRKAVTERVWGHPFRHPRPRRRALDDPPGSHARKRLPPSIEEQSSPALSTVEGRAERMQVDREGADHAPADRNEAFLSPFAENADEVLGEEQVGHPESAELGDTE